MGLKRQVMDMNICELLFGCKQKVDADLFFFRLWDPYVE
jgi:hypothetical protein